MTILMDLDLDLDLDLEGLVIPRRLVRLPGLCKYSDRHHKSKWKLCCDRQSVGLSVLVSHPPLGPNDQIFLFFCVTIA
jgi:hypothetical protein